MLAIHFFLFCLYYSTYLLASHLLNKLLRNKRELFSRKRLMENYIQGRQNFLKKVVNVVSAVLRFSSAEYLCLSVVMFFG